MILESFIRQTETKDVDQIVKINRACLPENYSVAIILGILRDYGSICCVEDLGDGQLGGYVLSRYERFFPSPISLPKTRAHIISVATLPEFRRRGVAQKMMHYIHERVINESKSVEIILEVRRTNHAARNLYKRLNYYDAEILEGYYRDGEDAVLMKFDILR
jgi:ribosomal protein S18 acetylase RimI-like enzyme